MKSILLLIIFIYPMMLFSFSGNGSGTTGDPYQITTIEQLQEMNDELDAYYILMNDIDATETADWNYGNGFIPIGYNDVNGFVGSLDGQHHTIAYLNLDRSDENNIGLFAHIGSNTDETKGVKNLAISDCNVIGGENVGGLVGMNEGIITNCSTTGYVEGNRNVGGLCGNLSLGKIENSHSTATSDGWYVVGGFCGILDKAETNHCFATGMVDGTNQVGGFCGGVFDGTISSCYSTGPIDGTNDVGGFCGFAYSTYNFKNCYSTSFIDANEYVGGFCGKNTNSVIKYCYSTGYINASNLYGGFCGVTETAAINSNCYWDIITSGCTESDGGEGKSTSEMKERDTYVNWDYENAWQISPGINNGYPTLQNMGPVSVDEFIYGNEVPSICVYPNPFSELSVISFQLSVAEPVRIVVYNSLGCEVTVLVDEYKEAGRHEARFVAVGLPQGMYYYTITIGDKTESGKMLLVR